MKYLLPILALLTSPVHAKKLVCTAQTPDENGTSLSFYIDHSIPSLNLDELDHMQENLDEADLDYMYAHAVFNASEGTKYVSGNYVSLNGKARDESCKERPEWTGRQVYQINPRAMNAVIEEHTERTLSKFSAVVSYNPNSNLAIYCVSIPELGRYLGSVYNCQEVESPGRPVAATPPAPEHCLDNKGLLRSGGSSLTARECAQNDLAKISYDEAKTACPAGTHLPSIRELAVPNRMMYASGDLRNKVPAGYSLVRFDRDQFYYKNAAPFQSEDPNDVWLWSSSLDTGSANIVFVLNQNKGDIDIFNRDGSANVRCVR